MRAPPRRARFQVQLALQLKRHPRRHRRGVTPVWVLISMTSLATLPHPSAAPTTVPTTAPTTEALLTQRDRLPAGHPDRAGLRTRAIEANLPMARRLARRYAGRGEALEDLTQVAAMALVKAVDGFDPSRPTPFVGYAVPSILGALKRHFRDAGWVMRVPRSTQEMVRLVRGGTADLTHQLSRRPTAAETALHLEVTVAVVQDAVAAAQVYRLDSLDVLADRPDGAPSVTLARATAVVDPGFTEVDDRMMLGTFVAAMPARDRQILTMRYYNEMTQATIATEIGVSQMHVSRLLKLALTQLRHSIDGTTAMGGRPAGSRSA